MKHGTQQTGLPPCVPRIQLLDSLPPRLLPPADAAGREVRLCLFCCTCRYNQQKVWLCSYQLTRPLALSISKTCDSTTNEILFSTSLPPPAVGEDPSLPQGQVSETCLPLEKKKCQFHERPRKTECV